MNDDVMPMDANAKPVEAVQHDQAAMMRVILRVLSGRSLAVLGIVLVFALGCWAMLAPTLLRVCVAGGFALFVLLAQALHGWSER